jgi:hypothetical protein
LALLLTLAELPPASAPAASAALIVKSELALLKESRWSPGRKTGQATSCSRGKAVVADAGFTPQFLFAKPGYSPRAITSFMISFVPP